MDQPAIPPAFVTRLLRLDGLAVAVASIATYAVIGGNWWLFAALILAPDLAFLTIPFGRRTMAMTYDVVHSYFLPILLGAAGTVASLPMLLPVALIWATHIGVDRALGYGLKYPESIETTHLGLIGKARKSARADSRQDLT
jgi:hypothetical protein